MNLTPQQQSILDGFVDPYEKTGGSFQWDEDYQRLILGMLLTDFNFLIQNIDLVKPKYFYNENHILICSVLYNHFDKYKSIPSKIILTQAIKDRLKDKKESIKITAIGELNTVSEWYVPGLESRDALQDKIINFAKAQTLKEAYFRTFDEIKKAPEDEDTWIKVYDMLRDAMNVERKLDIGLEYFQSYMERYERMKLERTQSVRFSTGFNSIDEGITGGGLSVGEILAWFAMSGSGKSIALVVGAIKNLIQGKKVLYLSLENDQDKTAERFDAQLANVNIDRLLANKNVVFEALQDHVKDQEDKRRLVIKQFPGGSCDVNMIRAYHNQLKMYNFKPDLVIVDYIGEMKDYPGIPTWESRFKIIRDLRGFGIEEKHCTFTALQANRDGVEAQKDGFIDESKLGDSYNQVKPLDLLISINQTEKEKRACIGRVFISKNRNGASKYSFKIGFDYKQTEFDFSKTLKMYEIDDRTYACRLNEVKETISEEVQIDKVINPIWKDKDEE